MLKILQASLQQNMTWKLLGVQAGFRKDRETRNQIANICWIIKKAKEFQKNDYLFLIDYVKTFDCLDHNKLWKTQEMGIPDHLICLLRNLYAGQEATVRNGYGTTDWFQIGKGIRQNCILSPCLFNLYAEYIMQSAGMDEVQPRIRIARRNMNNLRYAGDTTLMAEREEKLKSLLMNVKEESEKFGLKLNIQKTKIMTSSPIPSWQIEGETMETERDLIFGGLQDHCRWWLQRWKKLAPWKKSYDKHIQHIKKQRQDVANSSPSSQSCGFSNSHVWMWGIRL